MQLQYYGLQFALLYRTSVHKIISWGGGGGGGGGGGPYAVHRFDLASFPGLPRERSNTYQLTIYQEGGGGGGGGGVLA